MNTIFEQGSFHFYSKIRLDEARGPITESSTLYAKRKTTVFVSHKHDELGDLKDVIGFLETEYNVLAYIDSRDPSMPEKTSAETATSLKSRIKQCDKFLLLATNGAIQSKWCNWELGFGDAHKFQDHIAILPMKPRGTVDSDYVGTEYMRIYPYIAYYNGTEFYKDGRPIPKGYYIRREETDNCFIITRLEDWLLNR